MIAPSVHDGNAGYTYTSAIVNAWAEGRLSRMWGIGPRIVSGQLEKRRGGGVWKSLDRFQDITPALLDECALYGVEHPSSYSSIYHALARTPRVLSTYNRMLEWWPGGPWQEAIACGVFPGVWYRYDLRSAYRWAATCGLPDTDTLGACRVRDASQHDGIWIVEVEPRIDLPMCFRGGGLVVMTSEEIRAFGLARRAYRILRGLTWSKTLAPDYVERILAKFSFAKSIGRAYWGRWISKEPLRTVTRKSTHDTPNHCLNFIWGHVIVSRVRLRVWQAALQAAHVFVDEVLVPHELETGESLGDWHLKERYQHGILVKRTGHYGPLGGKAVMRTGIAKTAEGLDNATLHS